MKLIEMTKLLDAYYIENAYKGRKFNLGDKVKIKGDDKNINYISKIIYHEGNSKDYFEKEFIKRKMWDELDPSREYDSNFIYDFIERYKFKDTYEVFGEKGNKLKEDDLELISPSDLDCKYIIGGEFINNWRMCMLTIAGEKEIAKKIKIEREI